jgi:hypothetical protein
MASDRSQAVAIVAIAQRCADRLAGRTVQGSVRAG